MSAILLRIYTRVRLMIHQQQLGRPPHRSNFDQMSNFIKYRMMFGLQWRNVYAPTRELFDVYFPQLRGTEGNRHQNMLCVDIETRVTYL